MIFTTYSPDSLVARMRAFQYCGGLVLADRRPICFSRPAIRRDEPGTVGIGLKPQPAPAGHQRQLLGIPIPEGSARAMMGSNCSLVASRSRIRPRGHDVDWVEQTLRSVGRIWTSPRDRGRLNREPQNDLRESAQIHEFIRPIRRCSVRCLACRLKTPSEHVLISCSCKAIRRP